jgi:hypothetical protein
MTGAALALWRILSARPALRAAVLGALVLAALGGAAALYVRGVRSEAAIEARRVLDIQENEEIQNAIERSKIGPRPSGAEFLDCLRHAGPGCL